MRGNGPLGLFMAQVPQSHQENQLEWEGNHENTRNDVLHKLKHFDILSFAPLRTEPRLAQQANPCTFFGCIEVPFHRCGLEERIRTSLEVGLTP